MRIEKDEKKKTIIRGPLSGEKGRRFAEIAFTVERWNIKNKSGVTFSSSTGFVLPDGSLKSPAVAWIKKEKWDKLSNKERNSFVPFAPDFLVEVLSPGDKLITAQAKMQKWIQNGAELGWLIVPKDQIVFIYRTCGTSDKVEGFDKKVSGENILPGFEFDLYVLKG